MSSIYEALRKLESEKQHGIPKMGVRGRVLEPDEPKRRLREPFPRAWIAAGALLVVGGLAISIGIDVARRRPVASDKPPVVSSTEKKGTAPRQTVVLSPAPSPAPTEVEEEPLGILTGEIEAPLESETELRSRPLDFVEPALQPPVVEPVPPVAASLEGPAYKTADTVPFSPARTDAPAALQPARPSTLRLVGVLYHPLASKRSATIQFAGLGTSQTVHEGETLHGFEIVKIVPRKIEIARGRRRLELRIGETLTLR